MMDTLTINPEKCTACRACELTCSFIKEAVFAPSLSRIHVIRLMDRGLNVPTVCMHCTRPDCIEVCPKGAVYIDRSVPVVRINEKDCIGCKECVKACPFGAIDFNLEKKVAYMCDLCGGDPACVKSCTCGALTFRLKANVAEKKRRARAESYALLRHASWNSRQRVSNHDKGFR